MTRRLFREGGPHNIRETSPGMYRASIALEPDAHGMLARACPDDSCAPGYFKLKPGTGLTAPQALSYCPYCGHSALPSAFPSRAQVDYGKAVLIEEAKQGVQDMIRDALGLDSSGRRRMGGGFISVEMKLQAAPRQTVPWPIEEELRRNLTCPYCGLAHAVFGLASICPDCGRDILMAHVREELAVVSKILDAVPRRMEQLGARVAARDVENALEDVVSIFEAVMKFITRKKLLRSGESAEVVADIFRKDVRNEYQNVAKAARVYRELVGGDLYQCITEQEVGVLTQTFEKRHPITHNLGIVDRQYLRRAATGELEGREVRVTTDELREIITIIERVMEDACQTLNGSRSEPPALSGTSESLSAHPEATPNKLPAELGGLSAAAIAIARYLIEHSQLGHDRDPTVPLRDIEKHMQIPKLDLLAGALELQGIDCLSLSELPGSNDEVALRPHLFELGDIVWKGWNVVQDATTLAAAAIDRDALVIPEIAETLGWSPRRLNPALEYLIGHHLAEDGPYAHPYIAFRIQENAMTRQFVEEARADRSQGGI